jgi:hypothetical protein
VIVAGIHDRQERIILRMYGSAPPSAVRIVVAAGLNYAFEQGYYAPPAARRLHCLKAKQRCLITANGTV